MIAVSLEAVSSSPMLSLLSIVVIVQSLSRVQLFAIPWTATCQASLSSTMSWSLLKLMSIELLMTSIHFILHRRLLLHSIFPISGVFSNELSIRTVFVSVSLGNVLKAEVFATSIMSPGTSSAQIQPAI